jgi:hypothetical protein
MPAFSCTMPTLRSVLAAVLLMFAVARPAAAVDWTDLWWNSLENGWGVNFVQANDFIFATFFVYGPNQQPTWVTAQMSVDANGIWSGPLYQTTGPYYGGVWDSTQRTTTQVGTATFSPATSYSGTLTYNVNNVNVSKPITRQTLKTIPLGGNYFGGLTSIFTNCTDANNNGTENLFINVTVTQVPGGNLKIDFGNSTSACTIQGNYTQDGQLYRIPGAAYFCGTTVVTNNASVTQIKATAQGIEGQWRANVSSLYAGCTESAYFSAVLF